MKKTYFLLIVFFIFLKSYSCDCNKKSFIEDFTTSEYVFEGIVTSKIYSKDFLNYTITFSIYKHYKISDYPKKISFTFPAEFKYTHYLTSCDFHVNLKEKWLVYAKKSYNGKLYFDINCSDSQRLLNKPLNILYKRRLEFGNTLKIDDFLYQNDFKTNYYSSISSLDSIFIKGNKKEYKDKMVLFSLLIDTNGKLKFVGDSRKVIAIYDSIFKFQKGIKIDSTFEPTEFQKDAINLINKVEKWDVRKHPFSNIPLSYLQYIWIEYDYKNKKWTYELR
jgi:hypothetical protein